MVKLVFVMPDETEKHVDADIGSTLLQLAFEYDLNIEGACEGNMACSTCHMVIAKDMFSVLPEPSEEEDEMLDLAVGLTSTSRLGCQIVVAENMEGMRIHIPRESRNMLGF